MPDEKRIRTMVRLAVMDKRYADQMRQVRDSYRSDYIGKRVLGRLFGYTAFFLILLCLGGIFCLEFLSGVLVKGQLGELSVCLLIAYLVPLLFCGVTGYWKASREYQENVDRVMEYDRLAGDLLNSYEKEEGKK